MKKRVLFLVGGRSGEHEISLISGKNVLQALDRERFDSVTIIVQKDGAMTLGSESELAKLPSNPHLVKTPQGPVVSLQPFSNGKQKPSVIAEGARYEFDIAFPILHGPGGEDGTVQGLFEMAGVPVVGCDVKSSAICMDKGLTKKICAQAGLPVAPFHEFFREEQKTLRCPWPFPVFVKPATLGSSLGVSKAKNAAEFQAAIDAAFKMDRKILIEQAIEGRELEIAILGKREALIASPAGEIVMEGDEFYSYDAKYVSESAARLVLPAALEPSTLKRFQDTAKSIFNALECHGMARIDFFMTTKGEFLLNEVNTIPGFTPISMYPKLLQLERITYPQLVSRLIQLAEEKN